VTLMAQTTTKARPYVNKAAAKIARHAVSSGRTGKVEVTIIDATGLVLGRMATTAAKRAISGDEVHIVNAEKAIIVGSSRRAIQERYLHKRLTGTSRKGPFFPRAPHLLVKRTCRGMINYQSPSGRAAYKRIKAHVGVPKELAGQKAVSVESAQRDARTFLTVLELAQWLGHYREA
jgi:large subunit ribosomal protein L13